MLCSSPQNIEIEQMCPFTINTSEMILGVRKFPKSKFRMSTFRRHFPKIEDDGKTWNVGGRRPPTFHWSFFHQVHWTGGKVEHAKMKRNIESLQKTLKKRSTLAEKRWKTHYSESAAFIRNLHFIGSECRHSEKNLRKKNVPMYPSTRMAPKRGRMPPAIDMMLQ